MARALSNLLAASAACATLGACSTARDDNGAVLKERLMGLPLSYDLRPARLDQTRRIMNEFSIAYLKSDREALAAVLTDDFVWHVHDGEDSAHGKTYHGVDAMLTVLAQRAEDWSDTSYSEIEFHASGDRVFQQFRVKGNDRRFGRFDSYGIDIYVIRDGRIASKDSYWKRQTQ